MQSISLFIIYKIFMVIAFFKEIIEAKTDPEEQDIEIVAIYIKP